MNEIAQEIVDGRNRFGLPPVKAWLVVTAAHGLHSDHATEAAAQAAAARYRNFAFPNEPEMVEVVRV